MFKHGGKTHKSLKRDNTWSIQVCKHVKFMHPSMCKKKRPFLGQIWCQETNINEQNQSTSWRVFRGHCSRKRSVTRRRFAKRESGKQTKNREQTIIGAFWVVNNYAQWQSQFWRAWSNERNIFETKVWCTIGFDWHNGNCKKVILQTLISPDIVTF